VIVDDRKRIVKPGIRRAKQRAADAGRPSRNSGEIAVRACPRGDLFSI
jgi:hypothetical protein